MLLIDTDVLIDYLRGYNKAITYLEKLRGPLLISVITISELFSGAKEKEEATLTRFLNIFQSVSLNSEIATLGGRLRQKYGKSHGTGLADALIAASAIAKDAKLVTLNARHFPMMDVTLPYKNSVESGRILHRC